MYNKVSLLNRMLDVCCWLLTAAVPLLFSRLSCPTVMPLSCAVRLCLSEKPILKVAGGGEAVKEEVEILYEIQLDRPISYAFPSRLILLLLIASKQTHTQTHDLWRILFIYSFELVFWYFWFRKLWINERAVECRYHTRPVSVSVWSATATAAAIKQCPVRNYKLACGVSNRKPFNFGINSFPIHSFFDYLKLHTCWLLIQSSYYWIIEVSLGCIHHAGTLRRASLRCV